MTLKDSLIIINEIKKLNPKLNEFEQNFLLSIEQNNKTLSKKQESVLLNIYAKVTGGGIYQNREVIK